MEASVNRHSVPLTLTQFMPVINRYVKEHPLFQSLQ